MDGSDEERPEIATGIHGRGGPMRRAGALPRSSMTSRGFRA
jgi:hypothetical protein